MNLPNKLTLFRILLVPFFVVVLLLGEQIPHSWLIAFVIFSVASYTDHLDGMLARKNGQITDFGKFMDPLADKILVVSALVCFVDLGVMPAWCVILVIAREFMVTSVRLVAAGKGTVVAANFWGKLKTVSQITAILTVMLLQYFGELAAMGNSLGTLTEKTAIDTVYPVISTVMTLLMTLLSVFSGVVYVKQNWTLIKTAK